VAIEHARRLGNAELFDRPPPPDRDKVVQNLTELPVIPELLQLPRWAGSLHSLPVSEDRLAAILAVPDHPRILVDLASDPSSPVRSHAAAVAAFLQIEAVIPPLMSMLEVPIPPGPWRAPGMPSESSSASRIRANRYAEAVATWRVAVVGLAGFDRRELFPRLMALLFDPPGWFVPPQQLDLEHDRREVYRAREAVYRMVVRSGGPAEWEGLKAFESQTLPSPSGLREQLPGQPHSEEGEVSVAIARYFSGIESHRRSLTAETTIDQIAIRGERARARLDIGATAQREMYRISLRRQDGIWRVDDYWACSEN
jgi:hypothetical protein